jgi:hypothetical protein
MSGRFVSKSLSDAICQYSEFHSVKQLKLFGLLDEIVDKFLSPT